MGLPNAGLVLHSASTCIGLAKDADANEGTVSNVSLQVAQPSVQPLSTPSQPLIAHTPSPHLDKAVAKGSGQAVQRHAERVLQRKRRCVQRRRGVAGCTAQAARKLGSHEAKEKCGMFPPLSAQHARTGVGRSVAVTAPGPGAQLARRQAGSGPHELLRGAQRAQQAHQHLAQPRLRNGQHGTVAAMSCLQGVLNPATSRSTSIT